MNYLLHKYDSYIVQTMRAKERPQPETIALLESASCEHVSGGIPDIRVADHVRGYLNAENLTGGSLIKEQDASMRSKGLRGRTESMEVVGGI